MKIDLPQPPQDGSYAATQSGGFKKWFRDIWDVVTPLVQRHNDLDAELDALPSSMAAVKGLGEAWTAYDPALSGVTIGTGGSLVARYKRIGKTVHVHVVLVLGTGFAIPGPVSIGMPSAAFDSRAVAAAYGRPAGSGSSYNLVGYRAGGNTALILVHVGTTGAFANVTAAVPAAWAAGGYFVLDATYEEA